MKSDSLHSPFYDPEKTFEENFKDGPFGAYADGKVYKQKGEPQYDFLGQKVYLPFGVSACPIGMNAKSIQATFEKGFDIVTYKTVRSQAYPNHEWPNILAVHPKGKYTLKKGDKGILADHNYTEPLSIANSFGVGSFEPDMWQKDMKKALLSTGKGQVLIGGCQGTIQKDRGVKNYIDDFVLVAKLVKETGAKVIETNFSCPNEGTTDLLCFDIKRMKLIIEKIKNAIGNTPYIIKIAYFPDKNLLNQLIKDIGNSVEGIVAINTISTKFIDAKGEQAFPGNGRLRSGISGHAITWAGLEMVQELKKLREKFKMNYKIIGVGGVMEAKDYFEYTKTGADAVMSTTGAMWNPYLAQEIKHAI